MIQSSPAKTGRGEPRAVVKAGNVDRSPVVTSSTSTPSEVRATNSSPMAAVAGSTGTVESAHRAGTVVVGAVSTIGVNGRVFLGRSSARTVGTGEPVVALSSR